MRDAFFAAVCRFLPSHRIGLATLAGIRRSVLGNDALDEEGLLRLPA